jgi:hypothetical protein
MKDVIVAFKIAILTYTLGLFSCGLVGVIILIVKKITSKREEGAKGT